MRDVVVEWFDAGTDTVNFRIKVSSGPEGIVHTAHNGNRNNSVMF